ncbi:MAG: 1-acyl-sn-glycerol-3-phosphate acyltransferase [Alphaproteobacteria bacterium]|nr:1-acyl-sn-glycerol-3-phosphate acyltransferase [Alphaproteobacteria bacterium]
MKRLRALAFTGAFYVVTTLFALPTVFLLALPRRSTVGYARLWVAAILWLLARIVGLRHVVRGMDTVPAGPAIIAAKHQSAWDTLALFALFGDPAIVVKRELTWIPLFGWCLLRAGMVPVDRAGGATALRRLVATAGRLAVAGRPILIFPQGTRTPPGAARPYQPGIAALYAALDLPAVPVALDSGLFWPRRSILLEPGTIEVEILPAIPPGLDRRAFMARLEGAIEPATARLEACALASRRKGAAVVSGR